MWSRSIATGQLAALVAAVAAVGLLLAWQRDVTASAVGQVPPDAESEVGIPIEDVVVRKTCATCHTIDQKGQISRLSFQRKTPEGWERTIRRMAALNGMQTDPTTARYIVKYLSNHLGLAPDEARPAAFEVERRQTDYKYAANSDAESVCTKCHSLGRVISQRRTKNEWHLLVALHRGLYPQIDFQVFRRSGGAVDAAGDRPADTRQPVQKAVDHFVSAFPLRTASWMAWLATMRPPQIVGDWAIRGWEAGKGPFYGRAEIRASKEGAADEFVTELLYTFPKSGERVARSGQVVVYTGYQWRGRSTSDKHGEPALREVMWVDREWRTISGRWFSGGYDELGLDVELKRIGKATTVLGADVAALQAGAIDQPIKIYGVNLPVPLALSDIDFGPGITATRVDDSSPDGATIRVSVASAAAVGARDLVVAGAPLPAAVIVYDRIHRIAVTPRAAMARVGGIVFPKMIAQFEAHAYHNGPDNRPETADDLDLGMVPARWTLEEYAVRYGDDDIRFVGVLDETTGRFIPNVDGPNAERRGNANNIGDVWVVARISTLTGGSAGKALELTARAHLLVTVPLYMRWESPTQ